MDNKYGLGGTKVATGHHEIHHKSPMTHVKHCKFCGGADLVHCPTMQDHRCGHCGELQNDVPQGYSSGRSSDF
jgi:hypothetical protein